MEKEKTIHDIKVPPVVTTQMQEVAKFYVCNRLKEGFSKSSMFTNFSMSSKTWYKWMDIKEFADYIQAMEHLLIPEDELTAVRKIKKKILEIAYQDKVSREELNLFVKTFGYAIEADNKMRSEALGINKTTGVTDGKSIEERKRELMERLRS